MSHPHVAAALLRAEQIALEASLVATDGEWWADSEVVHAPHWHPDRQGDVCYPLVAQNGSDPEGDAYWAALLNPRRGPYLAAVFRAAAGQVERSSPGDPLVAAVHQLATELINATRRAAQTI